MRPQPRLDRVSSTPPKLWAIQAHPPAPGYLQGPTRRCRGGSCARARRRRRPTPVAARRTRSSERAGRAARSGQMRCGPWASAVRVGPHGPAWGARAGTERTELLRAVASYFVQYVDPDRHMHVHVSPQSGPMLFMSLLSLSVGWSPVCQVGWPSKCVKGDSRVSCPASATSIYGQPY